MKLHLGCGDRILEGFINVDARKIPGVDVVSDIHNLDMFEKKTASLIYASHVLEHVGRHEYMGVLKNWYGVLADGGILRISVPDVEKVFEHYHNHKDIRILRGFLYGGQTYKENYHYCAWDFKTLSEDLLAIGFTKVEKYNWQDTEHSHIDDFSQCYLPHMDKKNGMLMSLNVEATK
jgi:hypothetical protein